MATCHGTIVTAGPVVPETSVNNVDHLVGRTGQLVSTDDGSVFRLLGSEHDLIIRGFVSGGEAITLGDSAADSSNTLRIEASGDVEASDTAVEVTGTDALVLNLGRIFADGIGVYMTGSVTLDNRGSLRSGSTGVVVIGTAGADDAVIRNSGILSGAAGAIGASGSDDQTVRVFNTGTILGSPFLVEDDVAFIDFAGGRNVFRNSGLIDGMLILGDGDDRVDNRGGTITGSIVGGEGDDTFVPGAETEGIDGGEEGDADTDTLDFRSGGGLRLDLSDLDGSGNTGRAADDSYLGIERVWGSQKGADTLIGDAQENVLAGFGGGDTLRGGLDFDDLAGGAGIDTLRGGTGIDAFTYLLASHGGDTIADFATGQDYFRIDASGFGGDLSAGVFATDAQHRIRAGGNSATTAQERFIFRDSDDTLWFDVDGLGGSGPVLIADLQAGAVVNASDIVLV